MKASLEASGRRLEREHNERAWLAWHIAALTRSKAMPQLDRLQVKRQSSATRQRQSWQEQMGIMGMWSARMRRIEENKPKAK